MIRSDLANVFRDLIHEKPFSQCNMSADTCPDWELAYEFADTAQPVVENAVVDAVVKTMRIFKWMGATASETLEMAAKDTELRRIDNDCCPVCEEVICDSGCPLEPYRDTSKP